MTPSACCVHTHSVLCDGRNTLAEMAAAACAAGVRYFGASGHSHTPISHDVGNVLPADLSAYRRELLRLREEYASRMEVLFGLEWDSCSDQPPPDWLDYWIGSVHNLYDPSTGQYYVVDWDEDKLSACCDALYGGDWTALIRRYYGDVAALAAKKPTILGHLDLITRFNRQSRLFDEESPAYRAAALDALHAIDPSATLLELNAGAMIREYRSIPYPDLFILKEWRSMGGQIILTSDAHRTQDIVSGYEDATAVAMAAGYEKSALLTHEGPLACPLA